MNEREKRLKEDLQRARASLEKACAVIQVYADASKAPTSQLAQEFLSAEKVFEDIRKEEAI